MKHHKAQRTLGRVKKQRTALLRSLARSLILQEGIVTTEAKAKEVRPYVEKLITKSRTDGVAARRNISEEFNGDPSVVRKLFETIGPRYKARAGGYTRILKLQSTKADARKEARIELV
ncbi:MAG: 50S ribosomal protein L17 [Candidatus Paceibacterota bacterium]